MTDRGWRKILKGDVTPLAETVARIGEAAASYRARSGIAPQAERGKSWMLPEAKSEKLVYVAAGEVYVYAYGTNKLVGTLSRIGGTLYECSDKHGDVSVAVPGGASQPGVYEYAHGGTEPINYFSVAGAVACAVDPSSGNLAITNGGPTVYIYQNASGLPEAYTDDDEYTTDVAYDDSGNLFVDGFSETASFLLSELPAKGGSFENITVDGSEGGNGENPIFWDGQYLDLGSYQSAKRRRSSQEALQRLAISGTTATIAGYTPLGIQVEPSHVQFWIDGGVAIQVSTKPQKISVIQYFAYPRGRSTKKLKIQVLPRAVGLTVSAASR